ncbi:outer membrane beta-barrel protein [uncultured Sphingomonas sp.]|uniref:outer membrane beta-barrel protein n=1 Tax=uncultured Sphingomonas sp. TaxID=158754 RepID=UPI0035C9979A
MRIAALFCIGVSVAALLYSGPSAAQALIQGQGVADRARPDYDQRGARFGSYVLFPSVTLTAEATNNYLASNTNRRSDAYLVIAPELFVRGDFARTRVEGRAFATQALHANLPGENVGQYGASASGAFEPNRDWQLRTDVSAAHYVESRSSLGAFQDAREPVSYDVLHAGVGVTRRFVDLSVSANAALDDRNFGDASLRDRTPIDQDFRDVRLTTLGGTVQYDLRNGIALIANAQYDSEDYNDQTAAPGLIAPGVIDPGLNRDSSGFNILGGVSLELTSLVFGTVQVGYLKRSYDDPQFRDFSGLSYNADLLWNVTPLTSARFRASRSVQGTSSPFIAGNTRSDFRATVDHELYRYVILTGDVGYGRFRPNGVGIGGDEYYAGARARYLIDRRYSVSGGVRYSGRSSDSPFLRYNAAYADVSLRIAF